jgi:hypothetical protein
MTPQKPFAWSWSTLDMYDTCPKKLYHVKIIKDAKDEDSEFAAEGKAIHTALYERCVKGVALPLAMRPFERVVAPYAKLPGEKHGELKLALDAQLQPVDFFARTAWCRSIVDFLVVNKNRALLVDWKTGKPKDGFDQLKLSAAVMSRYMPEIEHFTVAYVWVKHADVKPSVTTLDKRHMRDVWTDCYEKVREIETAIKTTTFPAQDGPLCKWCPVRQCPHNRQEKK